MFLWPSIVTVQLSTPEQSPVKTVPGEVSVTMVFDEKIAVAADDCGYGAYGSTLQLIPPTELFMPEGELTTLKYLQPSAV